MTKIIEYKGYYIAFNLYNQGEYTIQIDGDDLWFMTEEEAKIFIDKEIRKRGQ